MTNFTQMVGYNFWIVLWAMLLSIVITVYISRQIIKDLKKEMAETEETLDLTEKECKELEWYFDKFVDYLWTKKANQVLNWKKWKY